MATATDAARVHARHGPVQRANQAWPPCLTFNLTGFLREELRAPSPPQFTRRDSLGTELVCVELGLIHSASFSAGQSAK